MKAFGPCLKKLVFYLIFGCCLFLLSCSEGTVPTASDKENIVVSGFLYTNEQVKDIRVVNTTPAGVKDTTIVLFDSTLDEFDTMRIMPVVPINDAEVVIYANGTPYPLVNTNDSGYYSDPDTSIVVKPGVTYQIEVKWYGKTAKAVTVIPEETQGLTLTRDTLLSVQQGGRPRQGSDTATTTAAPLDSALYTSKLKWHNPNRDPYYIVLQLKENVQQNNDSITGQNNRPDNRPRFTGGGFNRREGYLTLGDTVNVSSLRFRGRQRRQRGNVSSLMVRRPGTYEVRIYRVNDDYRRLDGFIRQQNRAERLGVGLFLEEPPSNVTDGLGIFAGFTSSAKIIHVVRQQ